jgi:hypothetical protein
MCEGELEVEVEANDVTLSHSSAQPRRSANELSSGVLIARSQHLTRDMMFRYFSIALV